MDCGTIQQNFEDLLIDQEDITSEIIIPEYLKVRPRQPILNFSHHEFTISISLHEYFARANRSVYMPSEMSPNSPPPSRFIRQRGERRRWAEMMSSKIHSMQQHSNPKMRLNKCLLSSRKYSFRKKKVMVSYSRFKARWDEFKLHCGEGMSMVNKMDWIRCNK